MDLTAAGVGICVLPTDCVQHRQDVSFVPLQGWHQALYMCILYDKWLEPPVWGFVEQLVRAIRKNNPST
jgi:DNA-binding transcriptional LysR family regulator